MGFQLWYSKETGIRRRGTTYSELQTIFINNITTKYIYEPLACCNLNDLTEEVLITLNRLDFDILGVIDNGRKIGYVRRQDLEKEPITNYLQQFEKDQIIPDSTPLTDLFEILSKDGFVFISSENEVDGIVTKADINKPIVRIY
jgi:predicted transcriptional regulator